MYCTVLHVHVYKHLTYVLYYILCVYRDTQDMSSVEMERSDEGRVYHVQIPGTFVEVNNNYCIIS